MSVVSVLFRSTCVKNGGNLAKISSFAQESAIRTAASCRTQFGGYSVMMGANESACRLSVAASSLPPLQSHGS